MIFLMKICLENKNQVLYKWKKQVSQSIYKNYKNFIHTYISFLLPLLQINHFIKKGKAIESNR